MILHGIEYQRPTSLNMRILADHVTYSFLAFMKSIFHFCLGCYCGGYSQNGRSNLSSLKLIVCERRYLKKILVYMGFRHRRPSIDVQRTPIYVCGILRPVESVMLLSKRRT